VKPHEGFRQLAVSRAEGAKEGTQPQRSVRGRFLLDRDADMERGSPVYIEGGKSLAESAWTCKQIDNAESGWQIRNLSKSDQSMYTG
jgi:hypothetical protein